MPVNDFKAFATGELANVLSQPEYEGLETLGTGFQSGIARSEELNKVWRQASTIAAVVASFMASKSGNDVLDNGNLDTLQATLLKALLNNSTSQLDGRYLKTASNLAELTNTSTARSNLGLKGAAVLDVGTVTDTVAAGNDARIVNALQRGSNLADVTNVGTARSNLGLKGAAVLDVGTVAGTVAAGNDARIVNALQKGSNLADVTNVGTARGNLGLKGAAVLDVGTVAGTVAAGDDARIVNALQVAPTVLTGNLNTLGAYASRGVYYQGMDANATPENNYPILQSGTLFVTPSAYGCQQEYTTFLTHRKFTRALTAQWNGNGPWSEWVEYTLLKGRQTPEFQSLELYHTTPVIDFHYGYTADDYDIRLINNFSGELALLGKKSPVFNNSNGLFLGKSIGTGWGAEFNSNVAPFTGYSVNVGNGDAWVPLISSKAQKNGGYVTAIAFGQYVSPGYVFNDPVIRVTNDNGTFGIWQFSNQSGNITYANTGGSKVVAFQDWVMAGVYDPLNYNKLSQDGASCAGFDSSDENLPYMRHTPTGKVIHLARQDWTRNYFVQSVRFGASSEYQERSNNERLAGGVMTSFADRGSSNYWIRVRPLQYLLNGAWVTAAYA